MKNFDDYPEFLSRKQFMDLTEWSNTKVWRLTKKGGKLAHIKITVLGKNSPPLFDKNELHTFLKNNDKGNQSSIEMGGIYKPKKEPKKPDDHAKNQDKGDQSKDPKKQDSQNKKGNGGDQSEGIYKPKKDPKKPDSPDKNGNGGDDHGQSL